MAIGQADASASMVELGEWLRRFASELGFDGGRYVHIGHRSQGAVASERPPLRFVSTLDAGQEQWRAGDPVLPTIVHAFKPFVWTARDDASLPDPQRAWLSVERLRGVDAGIAMPVQDYLTGPAYISLFSKSGRAAAEIVDLHGHQMIALAIDFHCRAKQLISIRQGSSSALSDRELSCLRHAAAGASLAQTAVSLSVGPRTVEKHFQRATHKLGAANRINAIAIAIASGFIRI